MDSLPPTRQMIVGRRMPEQLVTTAEASVSERCLPQPAQEKSKIDCA
jgi:hypothetical protein